jgi:hypothetical protein
MHSEQAISPLKSQSPKVINAARRLNFPRNLQVIKSRISTRSRLSDISSYSGIMMMCKQNLLFYKWGDSNAKVNNF